MKETDLAQKFVEYLSCYDLYFEVPFGRLVDIVAIEGKFSMAYEVKTTFNFKVLEQAIDNAKRFSYSYICVPDFQDKYVQIQLCKDYGLGLLVFSDHSFYDEVREIVKPLRNRHACVSSLLNIVREEHKRAIPGARSGQSNRTTAFGGTVLNAEFFVKRHQGCSLRELIEGIKHHYSSAESARGSLAQYIKNGVIKNILFINNKLYHKDYDKQDFTIF